MALTDLLDRLTLTRRLVKHLERTADALEVQCLLLERIANVLAPVTPEPSPEDLQTTGPAFRNDGRQARLEEWMEKYREMFHAEPSEDDIEQWLEEDRERMP